MLQLHIVITTLSALCILIPLSLLTLVVIYFKCKNTETENIKLTTRAKMNHDRYDYKKEEVLDRKDRRRAWEVLLETAKERLQEERCCSAPDQQKIAEWDTYLKVSDVH